MERELRGKHMLVDFFLGVSCGRRIGTSTSTKQFSYKRLQKDIMSERRNCAELLWGFRPFRGRGRGCGHRSLESNCGERAEHRHPIHSFLDAAIRGGAKE
jgi:hypothetical protein